MSASRQSMSPMEQGELEATPDFCDSPHIQLDMATDVDSKREKDAKKRKRDEEDRMEEYEDVLKIQPPQARVSSHDDGHKKLRRTDDKSDERLNKKSYYERERLEKLEKERKRLETERYRHLDKIQKERDHEREIARKERYGRVEENRREVGDKRDYKKAGKNSHSQEYDGHRKSRHERKAANVNSSSSSPPSNHHRDERKREHKKRERRSPDKVAEKTSRSSGYEKKEKKEDRTSHEVKVEDETTQDTNNETESENEEEIDDNQSPASVQSQSTPKLNRYHMVRSKFDDDEDEEEEEQEEPVNDHHFGDGDHESSSSSIHNSCGSVHDESDGNHDNDDDSVDESNNNADVIEISATPECVKSPEAVESSLPPFYPGLQGCRNVEEFHCLNRINEGTYGVVYRAIDLKTQEVVALKRLKMEKEKDGFPITSLREIKTLMKAQHPNIVTIRETVVGSNMDKIYLVMEYVEHDLKSLMDSMKEPFTIGEVKTMMIQLLKGVQHLHDNWIIHRDLKTSNLLLSHSGILKIGDFGLAREYGSPLKPYTPVVVTLWYRAPELLLGSKLYSTSIDIWSVGCIYAEFLLRKPLFPGKSEIEQLNCIFKDLGSPNDKIWPGVGELPIMKKVNFTQYQFNQLRKKFEQLVSEKGFQLMNGLLTYCPEKRLTADGALLHDYFNETPLPTHPSMFPTWPAKSELCRTKKSPRPPSGGKAYSKLLGDEDDSSKKTHIPPHGFFFKFAAA